MERMKSVLDCGVIVSCAGQDALANGSHGLKTRVEITTSRRGSGNAEVSRFGNSNSRSNKIYGQSCWLKEVLVSSGLGLSGDTRLGGQHLREPKNIEVSRFGNSNSRSNKG